MKIPDVVLQEASETMEMLEGPLVYLGKIGDVRNQMLLFCRIICIYQKLSVNLPPKRWHNAVILLTKGEILWHNRQLQSEWTLK